MMWLVTQTALTPNPSPASGRGELLGEAGEGSFWAAHVPPASSPT